MALPNAVPLQVDPGPTPTGISSDRVRACKAEVRENDHDPVLFLLLNNI